MRFVAVVVLVAAFVASCSAIRVDGELPPGFNSPTELATVLANEPDSARDSPRFASVGAEQIGQGDSITFRDDRRRDDEPESLREADQEGQDADTIEFDNQIEQINRDVRKLKHAIRESEGCSRRLVEQQAEVRSLNEQKEHLEREKEKRVLQNKLEKQMKDLSEINRMSRSLRQKFSELKHTQKLIKTKMSGTRNSLNQLESDGEPLSADEMKDAAKDIGSEVDAMQKAQTGLLARLHSRNTKNVQHAITNANKITQSTTAENDNDI